MDTIAIDGKIYKLVPIEKRSIVDEYEVSIPADTISPTRIKETEPIKEESSENRFAVPKVSDYRERYKQKRIKMSEIKVEPKIRDIENKDGFLEGYNYKGEGLFFGEGLSQDL